LANLILTCIGPIVGVPAVRRPGREADHSPLSTAEDNTSSWRGA